MKFFSKLFASKASPKGPPYEFPNDEDSNMDEAVASIWKWYNRLGKQIQISVQGMGNSVEQYNIQDADFKDGFLFWENGQDPDRIEIGSEEEFVQHFLNWAKKRMTPFSDTGEFCFAVYGLGDERLRQK